MAKQDDWVRLTVRLPPEVYARLSEIVANSPNSMNSEIVLRLEASLSLDKRSDEFFKPLRAGDKNAVAEIAKNLAAMTADLEAYARSIEGRQD